MAAQDSPEWMHGLAVNYKYVLMYVGRGRGHRPLPFASLPVV